MLNASIGQVETMEIVKVLCTDTLVTVRKLMIDLRWLTFFMTFQSPLFYKNVLKISIIYDPISAILVENDRAE